MGHFELAGSRYALEFDPTQGRLRLGREGEQRVALRHIDGPHYEAEIDGRTQPLVMVRVGDQIHIHAEGRHWLASYRSDYADGGDASSGAAAIAPMPGTVIAVQVTEGDAVAAGDILLTIESMKLQTMVRAEQDAIIRKLRFAEGEAFDKGAVLVEFENEKK